MRGWFSAASSVSTLDLPRRDPRPARLAWLVLNALQAAFTAIWTGIGICLVLALRVFLRGDWPLRVASRAWGPGLLRGAGARLRVHGLEHVDWSAPLVLVANHQSMIDIPALFAAVPVPLRFMLKQELARVPLVGAFARSMGMVFIDRGNARGAKRSLSAAVHLLQGGAAVVAFPEGTRSRDGRVAPFKAGALQVAIEAGAPVVPVAIRGSGAVLPASGFRVRPGTIDVRFGAPLPTSGLQAQDRNALAREAQARVASLLAGHGAA